MEKEMVEFEHEMKMMGVLEKLGMPHGRLIC